MTHYDRLTKADIIWRPYAFDRVTVLTYDGIPCSLLGVIWSKYSSGPNLCELAEAAAELTGVSGHYGLASCRALGYWSDYLPTVTP